MLWVQRQRPQPIMGGKADDDIAMLAPCLGGNTKFSRFPIGIIGTKHNRERQRAVIQHMHFGRRTCVMSDGTERKVRRGIRKIPTAPEPIKIFAPSLLIRRKKSEGEG